MARGGRRVARNAVTSRRWRGPAGPRHFGWREGAFCVRGTDRAMTHFHSGRRTVSCCVAAAVLAGALALPLWARHQSNPGPEDPPIKFHVPKPEPLSVEEALKTFKLPAGLRIE